MPHQTRRMYLFGTESREYTLLDLLGDIVGVVVGLYTGFKVFLFLGERIPGFGYFPIGLVAGLAVAGAVAALVKVIPTLIVVVSRSLLLKFLYKKYPFSDSLKNFMLTHSGFFQSLKLSSPNRFTSIPLIITSHTPMGHPRYQDEVIGMWYLDKSGQQCRRHRRICKFKQDFIVNLGTLNIEFVSYTENKSVGKYVRPLSEFFKHYGNRGKFYHDGSEWQHHYGSIDELPSGELKQLIIKNPGLLPPVLIPLMWNHFKLSPVRDFCGKFGDLKASVG